jgi:hypothetical protein
MTSPRRSRYSDSLAEAISKPPIVPGDTSSHTSEETAPSRTSRPHARSGQWRVIPLSRAPAHLPPPHLFRRYCHLVAGWVGLVVTQKPRSAAGLAWTLASRLVPGSGSGSSRLPGCIPAPVNSPNLPLLLGGPCSRRFPKQLPPRTASPCPARCVPAYSSVAGATSLHSTESSMLHRKSAMEPPPLHPPRPADPRFSVGCSSCDTSTPKRTRGR